MVYTLSFFSSKCSLFHKSNLFGSCIIHILYTGCAKIKKNNSSARRLTFCGHDLFLPIPFIRCLQLTVSNRVILTIKFFHYS